MLYVVQDNRCNKKYIMKRSIFEEVLQVYAILDYKSKHINNVDDLYFIRTIFKSMDKPLRKIINIGRVGEEIAPGYLLTPGYLFLCYPIMYKNLMTVSLA